MVSIGCGGSPGGGGDDGGDVPDDGRPAIDAPAGADAGPTTDLDVNKSGTRLKMRVGTTPDGARAFLGWRDTLRNDDCFFQYAADGAQRCLPSGATIGAFFRDAGCTQALGFVSLGACPSVPQPKYATKYDALCAAANRYGQRIYPVTGIHTGAIFTGSPTGCSATTIPGYVFYTLGTEVPPTDFAAATETLE